VARPQYNIIFMRRFHCQLNSALRQPSPAPPANRLVHTSNNAGDWPTKAVSNNKRHFFQIRGWSKGCHFLHLLREVQARCFISWQLYLLTQFSQYCTLKTAYDSKTSPCPSHYEQVKEAWSSLIAMTTRENNGTLVRLGLKPRDDAPTSMGRG